MRPIGWLAVALALLLAGAWLSSRAERRRPVAAREPVQFPTWLREPEYKRMLARRTLVVQASMVPVGALASPDEPAGPRRRDPFLVALPAGPEDPVLIFEANALRHSRLGELFVRCALAKDPKAFEAVQRRLGIDVLKDVDRVAFVGDALVVSGFFQRLDPDELRRATGAGEPERVGDGGVVYAAAPTASATGRGMVVATWRDQLVILADDRATALRALDQLEGRAALPELALPDQIAYGEAYGVIPGTALRRLLHGDRELLADRLAAAASRVELHVDAMQDVAAVATFRGTDAAAMSDLARAIGGLLAGARLHAQISGDDRAAELLDHASVAPASGAFAVNLALPIDRVESWFAGCRPAASEP
jgi:hypothetical protein